MLLATFTAALSIASSPTGVVTAVARKLVALVIRAGPDLLPRRLLLEARDVEFPSRLSLVIPMFAPSIAL